MADDLYPQTMSLWDRMKVVVGAFFSDPLGYMKDDGTTIANYQATKLKESGKTDEQIGQFFQDSTTYADQTQMGKLFNAVGDTAEGLINILGKILKNLPIILVVAAIILILYYLTPVLKKSNA